MRGSVTMNNYIAHEIEIVRFTESDVFTNSQNSELVSPVLGGKTEASDQ